MQQCEKWKKGWILVLIPATGSPDLFCTLTKEESFLGTDCSKGTCNEQHSRYFSPDV